MEPVSDKTRSFIAIEMPEDVIKEVARIQAQIAKTNFVGKLTELENVHLTLKFLGEIDANIVDKVKEKLKSLKFEPLKLKIGPIGKFNQGKERKIVWMKIYGDVFQFQGKVDEALKDLFPKEERFMSHITLARVKYVKDKLGFDTYIHQIKPRQIEFIVNEIKLKKSELLHSGPLYTTIEEIKAHEKII